MEDINPLPGLPDVESPFFEQIFSAKDVSPETLAIARSLHRNGYAILDFPDPDLDRLSAEIIARLDAEYDWQGWRAGERPSLRITDAWYGLGLETVRRIAANQEILRLLENLYGRTPIPFQTLNFAVGTQQALHSDAVHFDSRPGGFMCAVWVAFEDTDDDNGALQYYPGSHRLPVLNNHVLGVRVPDGDDPYVHYPLYEDAWTRLAASQNLELESFHARAGQALIWTSNLLHGGGPLRDLARTRHSQVTHYFFSDCCYYTPLLSNPFAGRISYKTIMNAGTGELVPNRLNDESVPQPFIDLCRG